MLTSGFLAPFNGISDIRFRDQNIHDSLSVSSRVSHFITCGFSAVCTDITERGVFTKQAMVLLVIRGPLRANNCMCTVEEIRQCESRPLAPVQESGFLLKSSVGQDTVGSTPIT